MTRTGDLGTPDRRQHRRYDLELNAYVRLARKPDDGTVWHGRTCNISVGGMLIACEAHPPRGTKIYVDIDWPSPAGGAQRLRLTVAGIVVRNEQWGTAVQITRHAFTTAVA